MHDAFDQKRFNFCKKKIFNYKTETETIDEIASNLIKLQIIMRNMKKTKASINLNVAFILINAVNDEAYALAKFYLKNMKNLTLCYVRKVMIIIIL